MLLCFLLWLYYMLLPTSPPLTATHTALAADGQSFQVATPSGRTRKKKKKKIVCKTAVDKIEEQMFLKDGVAWVWDWSKSLYPCGHFLYSQAWPLCQWYVLHPVIQSVFEVQYCGFISFYIQKDVFRLRKWHMQIQNKTNKNQKRTRTKQNKQTKSSRLLNTTEWILTA